VWIGRTLGAVPDVPQLRTERLVLRRWYADDRAPFAAMNADPQVMEHFPATLTRAASDAVVDRIEARFAQHGYGMWAVEVVGTAEFIGFTGLNPVTFDAPFTPAMEIGWRLARTAWGHGYATEAARAAVRFAFTDLDVAELVSFTATANLRSQAVMRRIDMTRDLAGDFDHPSVPEAHRVRRHVLYRLCRDRWGQGSP
jgi:ribosomal-protein-alanine N-acetyltransferase